jgi:hypothetical protein
MPRNGPPRGLQRTELISAFGVTADMTGPAAAPVANDPQRTLATCARTTRVWALCGPEQSRARTIWSAVQRFHVSSDLTGGDKNMRYALVIAMLLGSTLLAQAEPIDRDKWIAQTGRANKSCLAKFRQKFGEAKGHNYSGCTTDQTNKAIDDCVGSSEFSNCVLEKSLRVLEVCDLSSC